MKGNLAVGGEVTTPKNTTNDTTQPAGDTTGQTTYNTQPTDGTQTTGNSQTAEYFQTTHTT